MNESEYKLPKPLPNGIGCHIVPPWLQKITYTFKRVPKWKKTGIVIKDWEMLNHPAEVEKHASRRFVNREYEEKHKNAHLNTFKSSGIIELCKNKIARNIEELDMFCVKNGDLSSRLIAYNKNMNTINRDISSAMPSQDELLERFTKEEHQKDGIITKPTYTIGKGFSKPIKDLYYYIKIDLRKGFHNFLIPKRYRKYFTFIWEGKRWQFRTMIMGYSGSPGIFQSHLYNLIMKPVNYKFKTITGQYLDDMIFRSDDYEQLVKLGNYIQELAKKYNILINMEKSVFEPTHKITALGLDLDGKSHTIKINNIEKLDEKKEVDEIEGQFESYKEFLGWKVADLAITRWGKFHMPKENYEKFIKEQSEELKLSGELSWEEYSKLKNFWRITRAKLNNRRSLYIKDEFNSQNRIVESFKDFFRNYQPRFNKWITDDVNKDTDYIADFLWDKSNYQFKTHNYASSKITEWAVIAN